MNENIIEDGMVQEQARCANYCFVQRTVEENVLPLQCVCSCHHSECEKKAQPQDDAIAYRLR